MNADVTTTPQMIAMWDGRNTIEIYTSAEDMHRNDGLIERFQCSALNVSARNTALIQHGYFPATPTDMDWKPGRARTQVMNVQKVTADDTADY